MALTDGKANLQNKYFWGWVRHEAVWALSWEGAWDISVSRSSSIKPNRRILTKNSLAVKEFYFFPS